eukprot:jgi/Tetstr1/438045/TSEL_026671.t1
MALDEAAQCHQVVGAQPRWGTSVGVSDDTNDGAIEVVVKDSEGEEACDDEDDVWAEWEEEMDELLMSRSRSPSPVPASAGPAGKRRRSPSVVEAGQQGREKSARAGPGPNLERNVSLQEWMVAGSSGQPSRRTRGMLRASLDDWESRSPSVEFHPAAAARDGSPALPPAGPKPAPSAPAKSDLEALPYEVLRRVMCCLSAEGLATMANTSRAIRTLSTENSLWRRLYIGRWKMPDTRQLRTHRQRGALSWMGYYKDRDGEESQKTLERLPEEMREACVAMNLARRKTTLSLSSGTSMLGELAFADAAEADKVVEWRRQAGKPDAVPFHTCLSTHPGGPPCQYARVGDAMICQRSGWAHICDDTCSERIPTASGMLVCPISGRCFETLVEDDDEGAQRGGWREVHDEDHYGERGALGRSFEMGYSCSNEQDLQWFCGARLR